MSDPLYVVLCANGQVGSAVANSLLQDKLRVRVVLHSDKGTSDWKTKGAEVVQGNIDDKKSLHSAFQGCSVAFVMLPPALAVDDIIGTSTQRATKILKALRSAKVKSIVLLSSIGAELPSGTGLIQNAHQLEKALTEHHPQSPHSHKKHREGQPTEQIDYPSHITIARAAFFLDNYKRSLPYAKQSNVLVSLIHPKEKKIPMVSSADIGKIIAGELKSHASTTKGPFVEVIEVSGPETSTEDIALAVSQALGLSKDNLLTPTSIPPEGLKETLSKWGLNAEAIDLNIEMVNAINKSVIKPTKGLRRINGQTSLKDTAVAFLAN